MRKRKVKKAMRKVKKAWCRREDIMVMAQTKVHLSLITHNGALHWVVFGKYSDGEWYPDTDEGYAMARADFKQLWEWTHVGSILRGCGDDAEMTDMPQGDTGK
jgi:hypothetical protein